MKKYFYLPCRNTRRGAYTTMDGEVVRSSRTGNHWVERKEVDIGDIITIIDITNSGKHNCRKLEVIGFDPEAPEEEKVKTKTLVKADPYGVVCPICDR